MHLLDVICIDVLYHFCNTIHMYTVYIVFKDSLCNAFQYKQKWTMNATTLSITASASAIQYFSSR